MENEQPPPHVSVVLPCYNEEAHVLLEIQRICAALDAAD
ncbi:cellulose synthase/poly-beta-1,6-N-acetylglucosamine synthase-like glycosyltransferase, partial [Catenulispora sp. MAP5-51]